MLYEIYAVYQPENMRKTLWLPYIWNILETQSMHNAGEVSGLKGVGVYVLRGRIIATIYHLLTEHTGYIQPPYFYPLNNNTEALPVRKIYNFKATVVLAIL